VVDAKAGRLTGVALAASGVTALVSAIGLAQTRGRKQDVRPSLLGIDTKGKVAVPEIEFQWWPENISDGMSIGWVDKTIPGASHAIMQWGANGGRTISFTLKLSRSMRYLHDFRTGLAPGSNLNPDNDRNKGRNLNIKEMVYALRACCYPDYVQGTNKALPPVTCILNIPGLGLNENGSDYIFSVMVGCDVSYIKLFPDGQPRLADVSLSFRQIVQGTGGIAFKSRTDLLQRVWEGYPASFPEAPPVAHTP